jgi:acetolactate synthase-1/2/3 large subunit
MRKCVFLQVDPERSSSIARGARRRARGASAVADVDAAIDALSELAPSRGSAHEAWQRSASGDRVSARRLGSRAATERGKLHPVEACRPLQRLFDSHPDSVFVCDGGEFGQWGQACLRRAESRHQWCRRGRSVPALPFALAARLARPEAPVVALMGDGTFGFHMAEIDTAVRYALPFVAVVGNDARWNAEYQIPAAALRR